MTGGRPLRFLALMLCSWIGARGVALYREGQVERALPWIAPVARAIVTLAAPPAAARIVPVPPVPHRPGRAAVRGDRPVVTLAVVRRPAPSAPVPGLVAGEGPLAQAAAPPLAPAVQPPPIARGRSRLAGSTWLVARGGMTASVSGSQLGGSQAGARLTYALGDGRRVALAARVSAPLSGLGREAAVGFDWQPTRAPVHVVAERRIAIDGGRGGTMIGAIGGFGPQPVAPGVTLEGYGQAGVIARDGVEAFADGALRAAHPVAAVGRLRVDLGAGLWGGAQRGAARLDVGPSLGVVVPVGGHGLRLAADWRQRIAGDSRPGSGPALSIGTDF